jgi:predicted CopG family antitoxin
MITTIQIRDVVKNQLDKIKQSERQTYEEVILNLIKAAEMQKRKQEELLIEGCKVMAEDMTALNKELEGADADIDWEWK